MKYREELTKYVRRIIGDIPDVEDIVHDTLLAEIEHYGTLKDHTKIKPWVFRIARNKSIDFLKQQGRFLHQILDTGSEELSIQEEKSILTLAQNHVGTYTEVQDMYLRKHASVQEIKDFLMRIDTNVSFIPLEHLEALLLSEFMHLSQQEMANRLNLPLPTIKSRVQRAREKAKQVFLKCCYFQFDCRGRIVDYTPRKK